MKKLMIIGMLAFLSSCAPKIVAPLAKPSREYAQKVGGGHVPGFDRPQIKEGAFASSAVPAMNTGTMESRGRLQFVKDLPPEERPQVMAYEEQRHPQMYKDPNVDIVRSNRPAGDAYNGPLSYGDPGVSSSLWRASMRGNDLFQDDRAWQPYDLVTILVTEDSEGSKEADTEVKTSSSFTAAINNFLGFEADAVKSNPDLKLGSLINASTESDFKGEGDTTRKGSLKGIISAMVVEVLPGGILRIEGEKIISVNQEEQIMVISGLARPRDINSNNEVDSSKVAQLRIDYYGKGTVGSAQTGGWFGNILRVIWPF